ncbi:DinB family protein [Robertmurraya kyonggiensis]|uniref:DinB family protein n=1 Tax=Robertmurraya kyonggiensis TaxID=1037680 RepID=A0A4V5P1V4_9BACI|nr:DinB family protein [Robertmurraya kyonggiensis]TKC18830.1 DinB family protein [Robertmurraya kyonggiensis]
MHFPYRNDIRKTLIPYLTELDPIDWYKKSSAYPKSIAWIVAHIAMSEDYWINSIYLKREFSLRIDENSTPSELVNSYIQIRNETDTLLQSLEHSMFNEVVEVPTFSDGWVPPSEPTVEWLFDHVFTHEAYHTGQIAIIANLNNFKKPLF